MKTILEKGIAVYIEMPAEALFNRLENAAIPRPLLNGKNPDESLEIIKFLLKKRESFYLQSQIKVNGIDLTPNKLKEALSLFIGNS